MMESRKHCGMKLMIHDTTEKHESNEEQGEHKNMVHISDIKSIANKSVKQEPVLSVAYAKANMNHNVPQNTQPYVRHANGTCIERSDEEQFQHDGNSKEGSRNMYSIKRCISKVTSERNSENLQSAPTSRPGTCLNNRAMAQSVPPRGEDGEPAIKKKAINISFNTQEPNGVKLSKVYSMANLVRNIEAQTSELRKYFQVSEPFPANSLPKPKDASSSQVAGAAVTENKQPVVKLERLEISPAVAAQFGIHMESMDQVQSDTEKTDPEQLDCPDPDNLKYKVMNRKRRRKIMPQRGHTVRKHNKNHNNEAANMCKQCQQSFLSSSAFSLHKEMHSTTSTTCRLCKQTFSRVSVLRSHIRMHISMLEELVCAECKKEFSTKDEMGKHTCVSEGGDALLTCSTCNESVSFSQYHLHVLSHDDDIGERSSETEEYTPNSTAAKNSRCKSSVRGPLPRVLKQRRQVRRHPPFYKYPCSLCAAAFHFMTNLQVHMTEAHSSCVAGSSKLPAMQWVKRKYQEVRCPHGKIVPGTEKNPRQHNVENIASDIISLLLKFLDSSDVSENQLSIVAEKISKNYGVWADTLKDAIHTYKLMAKDTSSELTLEKKKSILYNLLVVVVVNPRTREEAKYFVRKSEEGTFYQCNFCRKDFKIEELLNHVDEKHVRKSPLCSICPGAQKRCYRKRSCYLQHLVVEPEIILPLCEIPADEITSAAEQSSDTCPAMAHLAEVEDAGEHVLPDLPENPGVIRIQDVMSLASSPSPKDAHDEKMEDGAPDVSQEIIEREVAADAILSSVKQDPDELEVSSAVKDAISSLSNELHEAEAALKRKGPEVVRLMPGSIAQTPLMPTPQLTLVMSGRNVAPLSEIEEMQCSSKGKESEQMSPMLNDVKDSIVEKTKENPNHNRYIQKPPAGVLPYKCELCKQSFLSPESLRCHLFLHDTTAQSAQNIHENSSTKKDVRSKTCVATGSIDKEAPKTVVSMVAARDDIKDIQVSYQIPAETPRTETLSKRPDTHEKSSTGSNWFSVSSSTVSEDPDVSICDVKPPAAKQKPTEEPVVIFVDDDNCTDDTGAMSHLPSSGGPNLSASPELSSLVCPPGDTALLPYAERTKNFVNFMRKMRLYSGLQSEAAKDSQLYVCSYCGKSFTSSKCLRSHIVRHRDQPAECNSEGRSFSSRTGSSRQGSSLADAKTPSENTVTSSTDATRNLEKGFSSMPSTSSVTSEPDEGEPCISSSSISSKRILVQPSVAAGEGCIKIWSEDKDMLSSPVYVTYNNNLRQELDIKVTVNHKSSSRAANDVASFRSVINLTVGGFNEQDCIDDQSSESEIKNAKIPFKHQQSGANNANSCCTDPSRQCGCKNRAVLQGGGSRSIDWTTDYCCNYCDSSFGDAKSVLSHCELKHPGKVSKPGTSSTAGAIKYDCQYCNSSFFSPEVIVTHLEKNHSDKFKQERDSNPKASVQFSIAHRSDCSERPDSQSSGQSSFYSDGSNSKSSYML